MRITTLPATLLLSTLCLSLAGCFETGVGDPAKAKVDQRFVGVWIQAHSGGFSKLVVKPWDEHTYLVTSHTPGETAPAVVFKGWLVEVDGQTYVTLEEQAEKFRKDRFLISQIEFKDGKIICHGLATTEKSGLARSPEAFEKYIRDNATKPDFFLEKNNPQIYEAEKK